jgi:hypothetical protein
MSKRKVISKEAGIEVYEFATGERLFCFLNGWKTPTRIVIVNITNSIYENEKIILFRYYKQKPRQWYYKAATDWEISIWHKYALEHKKKFK